MREEADEKEEMSNQTSSADTDSTTGQADPEVPTKVAAWQDMAWEEQRTGGRTGNWADRIKMFGERDVKLKSATFM